MKAKESGQYVARYLSECLGAKPTHIIQAGVGRGAECKYLMKPWPDAKLIGIEPIADCFNLENYPGEIVHAAVVGNEKSEAALVYVKRAHKTGSSLFGRGAATDTLRSVDAVTLDEVAARRAVFGGDVLLWLDCEGSELEALRGAENLLPYVKWINVEMTTNPPREFWPSANEIHPRLGGLGFVRCVTHSHDFSDQGVSYDAIYCRENEAIQRHMVDGAFYPHVRSDT